LLHTHYGLIYLTLLYTRCVTICYVVVTFTFTFTVVVTVYLHTFAVVRLRLVGYVHTRLRLLVGWFTFTFTLVTVVIYRFTVRCTFVWLVGFAVYVAVVLHLVLVYTVGCYLVVTRLRLLLFRLFGYVYLRFTFTRYVVVVVTPV